MYHLTVKSSGYFLRKICSGEYSFFEKRLSSDYNINCNVLYYIVHIIYYGACCTCLHADFLNI